MSNSLVYNNLSQKKKNKIDKLNLALVMTWFLLCYLFSDVSIAQYLPETENLKILKYFFQDISAFSAL